MTDPRVDGLLEFGCHADLVGLLPELPDDVTWVITPSTDGNFQHVKPSHDSQGAIYVDHRHLLIALDPEDAAALASRFDARTLKRNPTTWRVHVNPVDALDPSLRPHLVKAIATSLRRSASRMGRQRLEPVAQVTPISVSQQSASIAYSELSARVADLAAQLVPVFQKVWESGDSFSLRLEDDHYIQLAKWPEGMQTECSVGEEAPLGQPTFMQLRRLRDLEFERPQPPGLPNHYRRFFDREDIRREAEILARAAVMVHGWGASEPGPPAEPVPPVLVAGLMKVNPELVRLVVTALIDAVAGRAPVAVVDLYAPGGVRPSDDTFPRIAYSAIDGRSVTHPVIVVDGFDQPWDLADRLHVAGDVVACVELLEQEGRSVIIVGPHLMPDTLWLFRDVGLALSDQVVLAAWGAELRHFDDLAFDYLAGAQAINEYAEPPSSLLILDATGFDPSDSRSVGYADALVTLTDDDDVDALKLTVQTTLADWLPLSEASGQLVTTSSKASTPETPRVVVSNRSDAMEASNQGSARQRTADLWDEVIARWLDGDTDLPLDLQRWQAGYSGVVDHRWYPDPFVGDLRGEIAPPRLVVLGLNPGVGYAELQARDGIWADRIRRDGYSRCLERIAYDDPAWLQLHRRNSPYWSKLMSFARRWTFDDEISPAEVLNMELYPWHSDRVEGVLRPPADLLDTHVWQPISELDVTNVFAFGAGWMDICIEMEWNLLHLFGPRHTPIPGSEASGWNLAIFAMPSGQRAIVSWQGGFAGPPGGPRTAILRSILDDV